MPPTRFFAVFIAFSLGSTLAEAQDARREPGAHIHGEGLLSIAIDGKRLQMELEAPAADVVGFEHTPKTAAQKAAIADAKARLGKPGDLFKVSAEAGCKLVSTKIEVHGAAASATAHGGHSHSHSHSHSHAKAGKVEAKAEAKTAGGASGEAAASDASQHSEFHATYAFDCANPDKMRSIALGYFKTFKNAEKLKVTLIGPAGQSQGEATRAKPTFDLPAKP